MAANPVYDSDGEILEAPRGSGIENVDGFRQRTPWFASVDLHADYAVGAFGAGPRSTLLGDVFNVLNRREALDYDNYTEAAFSEPNPDFGRVIEYQEPISLRVGVRLSF